MVTIKFLFTSLICFFLFLFTYGQDDSLSGNMSLVFAVESMPEFHGGNKKLIKFVQSNINYPKKAQKDSIQGRVYVSFLVDTNGVTAEHQVIRGIRKDLNEEALRVAKLIKFEKPAMQRGKPVKVKYVIPIEFKLNDKKNLNKYKKQ